MKLCFLAPANSVHSYRWIKFFAENGHEVHWISLYPRSVDVPKGVRLYELKTCLPRKISFISAVIRVRKLLKRIKPDILHVHSLGIYSIGMFCGIKPCIGTAWGSEVLFAKESFLRKKYIQHILKKADIFTCDAHHMEEEMVKLGAEREKIHLIFFGIDTNRFSPRDDGKELRVRLNILDNPTVISLRSFLPVYNVESLIRAVPIVLDKNPKVKFLIVGGGPQGNFLKDLAKTLNVSRNILFLGEIDNKELPRYLNSADIYVSTALSDAGIAASTAEAMACGVPVVVTDSGENSKWISDGVNGYVVPTKDPERLADRIVHLINDEQLRKKMGQDGRRVIKEKNDYYVEMNKMEDIYQKLVRGSQAI